jgi:hypothetical protein
MKKRKLNNILIISGIVLVIVSFALSLIFAPTNYLGFPSTIFYFLGIAMALFGGLNYTKFPLWVKIIITIIGTPIIFFLLYLLYVFIHINILKLPI